MIPTVAQAMKTVDARASIELDEANGFGILVFHPRVGSACLAWVFESDTTQWLRVHLLSDVHAFSTGRGREHGQVRR